MSSENDSTSREFDLVIFGATGVTGQYVVEELAKLAKEEGLRWAIAGRNLSKLKNVLKNTAKIMSLSYEELSKVPLIEADVRNEDSIAKMCRRTRLVVNVVGPYLELGETVVRCCVQERTSQIDVAAEPPYLEEMQLKYHPEAEKAGIYVVGACGFASIPCELGIQQLKEDFKGQLNSVETYLYIKLQDEKTKKLKQVNVGSFISGLSLIPFIFKGRDLWEQLLSTIFTKPQPYYPDPLRRWYLKLTPDWKSLCIVNISCNESCAKRTQLHEYQLYNERPVQVRCYFILPKLLLALRWFLALFLVSPFTLFNYGRDLILKNIEFITGGIFTERKPSREEVKNDYFTVDFYGKGWPYKFDNPNDIPAEKPTVTVKLSLRGPDPAYITTAACVVQAALCILQESDRMPVKGVLPSGIAFRKTTLKERLAKYGLLYSSIEEL